MPTVGAEAPTHMDSMDSVVVETINSSRDFILIRWEIHRLCR